MSSELVIESGLQVFTRLIDRPSVQDLDNQLFFKGLENTSVVEIRGTIGSGTADLLNKLIAKCILPLRYNGLNVDVLFVNTENQLRVSKLYDTMHAEIGGVEGPVNVDGIVKSVLNNLKIVSCYSHQQLLLTLSSLDNLLLKNNRIGLIVVDSISAYFWQKKDESYNSYLIKLLGIIRKVTVEFKVVLVYTKQFDFATKKQTLKWHEGKKFLSYEISLSASEALGKLICNIKSGQDTKQLFYKIKDSSFVWSEVKQL